MNSELAHNTLLELANLGVKDFCVCPGARNAPLVEVLRKSTGLNLFQHPSENACGFFSLGRMKVTGQPVCVVTTSGTAVAELLPAVVEAHYSGLPLILLTADRPKSFRGSGSPQVIEQNGIFSNYVRDTFDWDSLPVEKISVGLGPLHVNLCFSEPLIQGDLPGNQFFGL